jgi:hypothetical protein
MRFSPLLTAIALAMPAAVSAQSMPGMNMPNPPPPAKQQPPPRGDAMQGMDMSADITVADRQMTGALGAGGMSREASGTAWQPDATPHAGYDANAGPWMLMGHALLNTVYDRQSGPRGGDKAFLSGMVMAMARRDFSDGGVLQLRGMLSPEPLMGRRGYPLLLAAGETANGRDPLVDRQHPHDLFMELSASYSLRLGAEGSLFVYGGLPGEPAFGPPAFMHRLSIMDSPEAPITHHWLDSTHISFGVVTAGLTWRSWKLEGSRFNGREPDQHRWDIETGPLDSTALRLSWNPARTLALQASWSRLRHPEQLEPGADQTRWSASAIWTRPLGGGGWWSTTLAWGRRSGDGSQHDALALESAVKLGALTIFGRGEYAENDELAFAAAGRAGPAYGVGKVSLGAVRDFRVAPHLALGLGALAARAFVPRPLAGLYGGARNGAMAFMRLKID